jgi:uncharacterized protein YbjT (DUF2867 family)
MADLSGWALNAPMSEHMNPTDTTGTTLVIGGTGKTGRRVAERLTAAGRPVRIGSRSAEIPFDWEDDATWAPALQDVAAVYITYQPDLAFPGAAERVSALVELAVKSGAGRLVLLSGRNEDGALAAEAAVQDSGVEWTIVRSSFFAQNFSESFFVESILAGEVAFVAGAEPEPFIDVDDIAEVVTAALTGDRHLGRLYEVTGPRLLTFAEAVEEIAEASGRSVAYVTISAAEFAAALAAEGLPAEEVAAYTELFTTITDGRSAYLGDGIQQALGRPPRDFRDFARDAAMTGVWAGE